MDKKIKTASSILPSEASEEPVEEQAPTTPAPDTRPQAAISTTTTATAQTIQNALTSASLPKGYLANGSMLDADGVMLPEYLEKYPQALAEALKPLSASSFQRAFLSKAKEVNKKKIPYNAKKNCAQGMIVQAMKLVNRKKDPAPAVLLDVVKLATATVVDDATFSVMFTHLDAIYTCLMME